MSWRASAYVKALTTMPATGERLRASQKLLLMILSDYHNDESNAAWPSLARLAEESLMSKRSAIRIIQECVDGGVLAVEPRWDARGGHASNLYRFVALTPSDNTSLGVPDPSDRALSPPSDRALSPPSDRALSPKPLFNVTEQPEKIDPALSRFWAMTLDYATLPDKLAREVRTMEPHSWTAGVLTLQAPAYLSRRRALADELLRLLVPVAPVDLHEVRIVNGQ